jgi:tetratricopeptide (TPR) repeat protein
VLLLSGTIALGIGLRVVFWWMQSRSGAVQPGDSTEYVQGALHLLLQGDYATGPKWLRPPLYPLLLAVTFALVGVDLARAMLVQAIVMGLGTFAFAGFGYALFRRRDVALVSALIAALFVPFAAYGSVLFAEALFVVLIAAFFAFVPYGTVDEQPSNRWALIAGGCFGLATLTRAVGLFFLPLAVVGMVVDAWKNKEQRTKNKEQRTKNKEQRTKNKEHENEEPDGNQHSTQHKRAENLTEINTAHSTQHKGFTPWSGAYNLKNRRSPLWRLLLRSGLFVFGSLILIAPWTIRNGLVYNRFIAVDTNGGVSFWYGAVHNDAELAQGEAQLAALPNLADKQRAALALAFEAIARDPQRYLSRVRYKVVSLWQLGSRNYAAGGIVSFDPDGYSLGQTPGELPLPLSLLGDAQYVLLVLAGILGFCFAPRERRSVLLVLWVLFGTLMSGLTIGHPRLRLPLLVAFVPYAAWTALMLPTIGRTLRGRWRATTCAALVSLGFLALIYTQHYARWMQAHITVWRGDRSDPALYRQAYDLNPANPFWLMTAADRAAAADDWTQAEHHYQQAVEQEPRSLYTHVKLIEAALRRGDPQQANDHLDAIRELGRDTNDLLAWAWARLDLPARPSVEPTQPSAIGQMVGFAPGEQGSDERWTLATAQVRLQAAQACQQLALELRGHRAGQPVAVEVAGDSTTLHVTTARTVYHVPLAAGACVAAQPLLVTLRTPTRVLDSDAQPWPVGVAVTKVSLE